MGVGQHSKFATFFPVVEYYSKKKTSIYHKSMIRNNDVIKLFMYFNASYTNKINYKTFSVRQMFVDDFYGTIKTIL